ncbi:MAG: hypothetical protein JOY60_10765 [Burkholderiaceae bacterium]|nr:hypothetical protein [Burkholderiaceae bacterium]
MKFFKLSAVAALLAGAALSASAMTSIDDESLAQVSGQDGVSIAANLNIGIQSFTYTNTTQSASIAFDNIKINGLVLMTVDVINAASLQTAIGTDAAAQGITVSDHGAALASFEGATGAGTGTSAVQFAFPNVNAVNGGLNISVGSVVLNGSAASFGSFAINKMDLQGTTVQMWAH